MKPENPLEALQDALAECENLHARISTLQHEIDSLKNKKHDLQYDLNQAESRIRDLEDDVRKG